MIRMELARIIISELTENQVIYLSECDGDREFPIMIGIFEATNIDRRVKEGYEPPRPLTHDLIVAMATAHSSTMERIEIHDLSQGTFHARIVCSHGDTDVVIDARPSDAIAVALSTKPPLPIFVAEDVLDVAAGDDD